LLYYDDDDDDNEEEEEDDDYDDDNGSCSDGDQGSRIRSVRILLFEGYVRSLTYSILAYT